MTTAELTKQAKNHKGMKFTAHDLGCGMKTINALAKNGAIADSGERNRNGLIVYVVA